MGQPNWLFSPEQSTPIRKEEGQASPHPNNPGPGTLRPPGQQPREDAEEGSGQGMSLSVTIFGGCVPVLWCLSHQLVQLLRHVYGAMSDAHLMGKGTKAQTATIYSELRLEPPAQNHSPFLMTITLVNMHD